MKLFWILGLGLGLGVIGVILWIVMRGKREGLVDRGSPLTNHNVPLPLTNTLTCRNFCGPASVCSLTQEQCTSDVDCYGCRPKIPPPETPTSPEPKAYDDAGKLTFQQPLRYSQLTTDLTRNAMRYGNGAGVPQGYQGKDLWTTSANFGYDLFLKKRYSLAEPTPTSLPLQTSVTGLFHTEEYSPANS